MTKKCYEEELVTVIFPQKEPRDWFSGATKRWQNSEDVQEMGGVPWAVQREDISQVLQRTRLFLLHLPAAPDNRQMSIPLHRIPGITEFPELKSEPG